MNGQLDILVIIFDQVNIRRCFRRSMIANRFFTMIVYFAFAIPLHCPIHTHVYVLYTIREGSDNRNRLLMRIAYIIKQVLA